METRDVIRSEYSGRDLSEVLRAPTTALLGVSQAAAVALTKLGIQTVFDLGVSWLFANAHKAADAARVQNVSGRVGAAPSDWLQPGTNYESLVRIADLPVESLRGINPADAAALKTALDIVTIRDFGLWPPRLTAQQLIGKVMGTTLDPEEQQTEELRPRLGEFPTERVYYSTLAMLQIDQDPASLIELNGPMELGPLAGMNNPFNRPAVGALLTYSQSWYVQGITLGHLLHCLALAPGESTRIAVVDWSRRTRTRSSERISESEELDNAAEHSRAVSEVQSLVASELQQGGSNAGGWAESSSSSRSGGSSSGLLGAVFGGSSGGGAKQSAESGYGAWSSSWSMGNRSVLGRMNQSVNDRTEQHASSVRSRRASAVREVSQSEHEEVSTRVVANYNHMHALTVQYYEVVQVYRIASQLHEAERCIFLPMETIAFRGKPGAAIVDRYRRVLTRAALSNRARSLLADPASTVSVTPVMPPGISAPAWNHQPLTITAFPVGTPGIHPPAAGTPLVGQPEAMQPATGTGTPVGLTPSPDAPGTSPLVPSVFAWDMMAIARVSEILNRTLVRPDSNAIHLPDDVQITGMRFSGVNVNRVQLDRIVGADPILDVASGSAIFELSSPLDLIDLKGILLSKSDDAARTGTLTLRCTHHGRRFESPPIPISMSRGVGIQRVLAVSSDSKDRQNELHLHLNENAAHYSDAIYRNLDPAEILTMMSQYRWNGRPLSEQVEPRPLGVSGNYLIFRAPVDPNESSGVTDGANTLSWGDLLRQRNLSFGETDTRLVPVPTGGVFAEAVLGRSNSAEKLDIHRFWNWQDSPIPLQATEIAPVTLGSRGTTDELTPGTLGQPVLNIVNPTSLPDPAGLTAGFNALGQQLFQNMSGLAGTQEMARSGMAETMAGATAAGQLASENMRTEAQKQVAMGQIAADIAKAAMGKPSIGGSKSAGISGEGAKINHARDMDKRGVPASPAPAGRGSSPGGGGIPSSSGSAGGESPRTTWAEGRSMGSNTSGGDSVPVASSYSREGAYADHSALGYSPEALNATVNPLDEDSTGGDVTPVLFDAQDVLLAQNLAPLWLNLLQFKVPNDVVTALTGRNMSVQSYDSAIGKLNIDGYGVRITTMPKINGAQVTPEELLAHIRKSFNTFIDTTYSEFSPYAAADDAAWNGADPKSAVMKIDIPGLDNAAVVVSESAPDHWRFTTVETPDTGRHPVTGHRDFGFRMDGSAVIIYTKGADRSSDSMETLFDFVTFWAGDKLWRSFQKKLAEFVNDPAQAGAATVIAPVSERIDWNAITAVLSPSIPI